MADFCAFCSADPEPEPESEPDPAPPPSDGEVIEVVAPAGKVGVIFVPALDPKYGHEVKTVKDTSPLFGKVNTGDIILAIDGDDTSQCDFNAIADALLAKKDAPERALKVLRPKV